MTNYHAFARDLRALAVLFDATGNGLPLPQFDIPLDVTFSVAEAVDVAQAARVLGVDAKVTPTGHSTAELHIDSVSLRFLHISDDAMAEYNARAEYARNMPEPVTA